jgi:hypothetical protein
MRLLTIAAGLLLATGVAVGLCRTTGHSDAREINTESSREVSIVLLGSARDLVGIDVPAGLSERRMEYLRVDHPSDVTLSLPTGLRAQLPVKYLSLSTQYGTVTDVDLLPLKKSVPFKEAVGELHRIMTALKITPDDRMKEKMRQWPDDSPGFDPVNRPGFFPANYRAGMSLSEDVAFDVKLRAPDDGGWFLVLTFSAQGPKRELKRGGANGAETATELKRFPVSPFPVCPRFRSRTRMPADPQATAPQRLATVGRAPVTMKRLHRMGCGIIPSRGSGGK